MWQNHARRCRNVRVAPAQVPPPGPTRPSSLQVRPRRPRSARDSLRLWACRLRRHDPAASAVTPGVVAAATSRPRSRRAWAAWRPGRSCPSRRTLASGFRRLRVRLGPVVRIGDSKAVFWAGHWQMGVCYSAEVRPRPSKFNTRSVRLTGRLECPAQGRKLASAVYAKVRSA